MSFQRFQLNSADKKIVSSDAASSVKSAAATDKSQYKPKHFEDHSHDDVAALARETAYGRFKLDKTVQQTLALEETERKKIEDRINDEIEKRWLLVKEKAEVDGYAAGLQQGKADAYKSELPKITQKLEYFENILREMDEQKEKIFQSNEAFMISLIGQIAKMITLKEIAVDQEYVKRIVIHLIHQLAQKDDIRVILSDSDLAMIESIKQAVGKEFGQLKNTSFESSSDIHSGGCKIETRHGVIDASVEAQIENALKALKN